MSVAELKDVLKEKGIACQWEESRFNRKIARRFKMSSGHLKRLVAPRSWNIARKERTWTTKPMPGKHSLEGALPISTILRDYLKVCDNNREAKIILHA